MTARAIRYSMTSVLLSRTICTCSPKIRNKSTAAGVYSFPSSVFFGGCTLSASRIFMYHFYRTQTDEKPSLRKFGAIQLLLLNYQAITIFNGDVGDKSTRVVACILSTYAFMRGSIAPLSEQTWANDSSTPSAIRFSWYSTTQPVTCVQKLRQWREAKSNYTKLKLDENHEDCIIPIRPEKKKRNAWSIIMTKQFLIQKNFIPWERYTFKISMFVSEVALSLSSLSIWINLSV